MDFQDFPDQISIILPFHRQEKASILTFVFCVRFWT